MLGPFFSGFSPAAFDGGKPSRVYLMKECALLYADHVQTGDAIERCVVVAEAAVCVDSDGSEANGDILHDLFCLCLIV